MKTFIVLLVSAYCFFNSLYSQDHRYSFSDKYELESPAKLKAYTTDGFIKVEPSSGNFVEVYYIVERGKNFLKISREEMDKYYILEVVENSSMIDISLRRRNENKWEVERDRFNVSCEIFVPVKTTCDLTSSSDGNITIRNLWANQKCITIDGNVSILNVHGDISASTSHGNVYVDSLRGNISLVNKKGDILINNVVGPVSSTTIDGNIRFSNCEGSFSGRTTFGDIRGNMKKLSGILKLITRNGDINIEIPENLGLDLQIKGHELHIPDLDEVTKMTKNQIYGSVHGGGIKVEILTTSGETTLSFK